VRTTEQEQKEVLTKEQVFDVLEFANTIYGYYNTGVWNPWSQNYNIKDLNNNAIQTDYSKILKALSDVKDNENTLCGYSEFMSTFDTIYQKTINLYVGMLSLNYRVSCDNWKDKSEFAKDEFKQDERRFYKFMRRFDYKKEFRNVLSQVLRTGRGFYWLRTTEGVINDTPFDDNVEVRNLPHYALQLLPQKTCLITGKSQDTYLFDVNFSYFLNSTTDINLYPPIFKQKYKEVFDGKQTKYTPNNQYNNRNGEYATWVQTSPKEGAWCFVWDDNNANAIPPFASLMKAVFDNTKIHELQLSKDLASAFALIYGEIGIMDKEVGGNKADQTKFTAKTMGTFMNIVQQSVQSIMKTVALPLENTRFGQFVDQNINMETTALETSANQGAFSSSLVYSSGKKSQTEVLNGITTDYNILSRMYSQFARFCEFYGNKKTKKYKFHVTFDGCEYPHEKQIRQDSIMKLADRGIVLNTSAFACAWGYDPFEFESMMAEASGGNMKDNLMLLLNVNTNLNKDSSKVGNPEKDDSELSDNGAISKNYQ
jgi:hypothetical protein